MTKRSKSIPVWRSAKIGICRRCFDENEAFGAVCDSCLSGCALDLFQHTITLSNGEGTIKAEQIQPLRGTVKVSGDCDTDVVFTDVETGKQYIIGYITHGMTEKIKLEKNKWYKVEGEGNLTMSPVNVRVE